MTLSDDQIGRARVKDTEELRQYYAELEEMEAGALWTVANEIEPWYPQPKSVPVHWRTTTLRPKLVEGRRTWSPATTPAAESSAWSTPGAGTSAPPWACSTPACRS